MPRSPFPATTSLPLVVPRRCPNRLQHPRAVLRFTVVMDSKEKKRLTEAARQTLAAFIKAHPAHLDELFRFTDPTVREVAINNASELSLHDAAILRDRAVYLTKTRIVHRAHQVTRCRDKVIYTEREAHAKSNRIWALGRGRMRVYHCPHCNGHHLTHTVHKDSDRQVA